MKTQFNVPAETMVEFAEILAENNLDNEITGTTEDEEVIVEVRFDKEEFEAVEQLTELIGEEEEE